MIHRLIVGAASVLILLMVVQAWRTRRNHATIFPAATVGAAFFFAQAFVGALKTTRGFPPSLLALHVATAVATWAALVVLVVLAGLDHQTVGEGVREAGSISLNRRLRDLLVLTRPLVVLLLLVTAFAGMVVGARTWPAAGLVFWTLLGGGLAAGGAQAVNQYVDRDMDALMTRTARRPIPAGRLTPAEGLAWGLFLCISSLYILVGFVSWLAAFLTLVGMVYYVLVYTLLLKRTSAQNIVIGGGAGAMAPVVGLAAAAGGLNVWALFLFAIVFLWTPPHFWALAIVKLKDYARANVPMMPVVRGERFTRGQIMLYALGLVLVSVLPPVFALAGPVYLISSILLGGILLYAAWTVWAKGGVNLAWRLYRISSLYLAFLFVALMVDVLH